MKNTWRAPKARGEGSSLFLAGGPVFSKKNGEGSILAPPMPTCEKLLFTIDMFDLSLAQDYPIQMIDNDVL